MTNPLLVHAHCTEAARGNPPEVFSSHEATGGTKHCRATSVQSTWQKIPPAVDNFLHTGGSIKALVFIHDHMSKSPEGGYSSEELEKMSQRALSDASLIEGGAKYVSDPSNDQPILEVPTNEVLNIAAEKKRTDARDKETEKECMEFIKKHESAIMALDKLLLDNDWIDIEHLKSFSPTELRDFLKDRNAAPVVLVSSIGNTESFQVIDKKFAASIIAFFESRPELDFGSQSMLGQFTRKQGLKISDTMFSLLQSGQSDLSIQIKNLDDKGRAMEGKRSRSGDSDDWVSFSLRKVG